MPKPIRSSLLLLPLALAACEPRIGEGDKDWNRAVAQHRHELALPGSFLHYVDLGEGDPVLMVHGFADSSYCWHENAPALRDAGFRTVLADQPGMGRSGMPAADWVYAIENQAAAILALADHLDLQRFHMAGSSMGGAIALYLALHHPQRVASLALFDPASQALEGGHMKLAGSALAGLGAETLCGRWVFKAVLRQVYYDDALVDSTLVDEYARPARKDGYRAAMGRLARDYFSPAYHDMTARYGELRAPALVVWGAEDAWLPASMGQDLAERLPAARLDVIPQAGHLPHQERPAVVNPLLLAFLEEQRMEDAEPATGSATAGPRD